MPPPMPNSSKRFLANPIRPARYRPGKAVPEQESSDEDEEEEVEQVKKPAARPQQRSAPQKPRAPVQAEVEEDDEEGFVTEDEDDVPVAKPAKGPHFSTSTLAQPVSQQVISKQQSTNEQESEDEESEEGSEEGSSEEEEDDSSSEEEPQRKFQRPTFIRKADRQKSPSQPNTIASVTTTMDPSIDEVDEQARRLAQAELYIKDKLERDALARSQGRKAWDDDEELDPEAQVDDTDGLDPTAEHAAWKLRELKRLKRDREAIEEREKEIEERERRRNLTQEERNAEDQEYIAKQKEERETGRGTVNFLAKYHHKGAFFQDDEMAEVLKKRDIMGAKFQDEVGDKSILPEYMRVRDMTKLGKKGRTRYKDLKNEDTGRFGEAVKRWRGSGYEQRDDGAGRDDLRGVDERFLPDNDRDRGGRDATGPTGANASAVGMRREKRPSRSRSRSPNRGRDGGHGRDRSDTFRPPPRRRSYSRSRSRERSYSPPRRKRSRSPYESREKRRRVEVD